MSYRQLRACFNSLPAHAGYSATVVAQSEFSVGIDTVFSAAIADAIRGLMYQNASKKMPSNKSIVKDLKKKTEKDHSPERVEQVTERLRNLGMAHPQTKEAPDVGERLEKTEEADSDR